jgi:glucose dehydrogenase
VSGKTVWHVDYTQPTQDPILATAGGLLFLGGDDEGVIRAINAKDGDTAWQFRTGNGSSATPVTYIGPDKEQYLAFISSSKPGVLEVGADAAPDAQNRYTREGSTLYVFKLHQSANVAAAK